MITPPSKRARACANGAHSKDGVCNGRKGASHHNPSVLRGCRRSKSRSTNTTSSALLRHAPTPCNACTHPAMVSCPSRQCRGGHTVRRGRRAPPPPHTNSLVMRPRAPLAVGDMLPAALHAHARARHRLVHTHRAGLNRNEPPGGTGDRGGGHGAVGVRRPGRLPAASATASNWESRARAAASSASSRAGSPPKY